MSFKEFQPYPKYKDSGVEWLGKVPEHWDVKRLKYSATINDEALPETTDPALELTYVDISSVDAIEGIVANEEMIFENAPSRARRIIRDGDTIISTVRTYLRAIAPIRSPRLNTIVSTGFAVVRPRNVKPSFMSYALRESGFVEAIVTRSVGVSYPAINSSEIGNIPFELPPSDEQLSIVSFLDQETSRIDTLISEKERLISLLQEYRQALISHAVTKGLDPKVKMKDSGVEWLGEIPEHWEIVPVKGVATCNDDVLDETTDEDFEIEYVEISGVDAYRGIVDTTVLPFGKAPSRARRRIQKGDILVSTVRTYLRAIASVHQLPDNMIASTGFAVIRPRSIESAFLGYLFHAEYIMAEIIARSVGVSYPAINANELMRLTIPLPLAPEQISIASFLDREASRIDTLISGARKFIDLLKEYRSSLITAAVIGKIDVRGYHV